MSLNVQDFKMPSNIVCVCSYDAYKDQYNIAFRWEWGGLQQGYNQVVTGHVAHSLMMQTLTIMIDTICIDNTQLWNQKQEDYFKARALEAAKTLVEHINNNKTQIKISGGTTKWATGNKVAKKLQAGTKVTAGGTLYINNEPVSSNHVGEIAKHLPGVMTKVDWPRWCQSDNSEFRPGLCGDGKASVYHLVQHLNDTHRFSREKIANWIDELHDAGIMNAEFQPWEEGSTSKDDCDTIEEADKPLSLTPLDENWQQGGYVSEEKAKEILLKSQENLNAQFAQLLEELKTEMEEENDKD